DGVLQTLQLAQDQGPVRPRTGQRDVEVVTTGFGGKSGGAIGGDAIAEGGGLAEKTALLVREVVLPGPDAVDELSHARDDKRRAGGSPRGHRRLRPDGQGAFRFARARGISRARLDAEPSRPRGRGDRALRGADPPGLSLGRIRLPRGLGSSDPHGGPLAFGPRGTERGAAFR